MSAKAYDILVNQFHLTDEEAEVLIRDMYVLAHTTIESYLNQKRLTRRAKALKRGRIEASSQNPPQQ